MLFRDMYEDTKYVPQVIKVADNETLVGSGVDMAGYEGVAFYVIALKGEALNYIMKGQQAQVSDYSDVADLKGSAVAFSTAVGTDGSAMLDIYRPTEEYVRPSIAVPDASAAKAIAIIAILYGGRMRPENNSGKLLSSPDEGTA